VLSSLAGLRDLESDTSILVWNDYLIHAKIALELGSTGFNELPKSASIPDKVVDIYHYGAYILPGLLIRALPNTSTISIYTSTVPVVGWFLLIISLQRYRWPLKHRISRQVILATIIFSLIYLVWCFLLKKEFFDPIWFLTFGGPSSLYAIACFMTFLTIYISDNLNRKKLFLLMLITLASIGVFKIQILHSLLLFFVILSFVEFRKGSPKIQLFPDLFFIWFLLLAILLLSNDLFGLSRDNPLRDFIYIFQYLSSHEVRNGAIQTIIAGNKHISLVKSSIFGSLLLIGPYCLMSISLVIRVILRKSMPPNRDITRLTYLFILIFISCFTGILAAPTWLPDTTEFQIRSWPILWISSIFYISRLPNDYFPSRFSATFGLILAIVLFHLASVHMVLNKLSNPTTPLSGSSAFPTLITRDIKNISNELVTSRRKINKSDSRFLLVDRVFRSDDSMFSALRVSALAGSVPHISMLQFYYDKGDVSTVSNWKDAAALKNSECTLIGKQQDIYDKPTVIYDSKRNLHIICGYPF
jgi:hypothetical protein